MSYLAKVGITHGDCNGVGYEILLKAFSDNRLTEILNPIIYGSSKAASYHRKVLNCKAIPFNIISQAEDAKESQINFINAVKNDVKIEIGVPNQSSGEASYVALEAAVADLQSSKIDVLVTLPINKDSIQGQNFNFPGHTEYLENRLGNGQKALMILASDQIRVALVTTHLPISRVAESITTDLIEEKIKTLNQSLKRDFFIDIPRIAVLSLNPHAGENGLLGKEEQEIIQPAIQKCVEQDIFCAGPFAADGFFGSERYKDFDAVLAMYHDQGLIPFKTLAMGSGVNFTAGLPIVRTSPAHGTAYDIAGKDLASEKSFQQAIYMAIDIYRNRVAYDEARKNPLRKIYFERGKDDEKLDLT
ncbi:MAG: 4-hydroxythreonine-4-phosphate dehydrogenase PdxA, partial [Dysgonamonadaceae bacterium]|nr:4-hydroxythreonine-4-phosphate dehydrogenase PdxA [Dysgonamonadaceae bacterium]MDD3728213.1 4-hydroxythreonine-4-phosphate dehydrogenase PdxA [Dysgonamonadaceae bacterium]